MTSLTATILFTDLVGSTEQRSRLGDVGADELRREHDALISAAVEDHGGTVVKTMGDGVLATFPSSADAVASAAEVQQRIEARNRRADDGHTLGVRIGLAAGDVEMEDGDCHGTPVVVAARLCGVAEGGQILCDDLVRGLAGSRSAHPIRPVGEHQLKGLDGPVSTSEVVWAPLVAETSPLPAALAPVPGELPFAGRTAERELLGVRWKEAQHEGRTVVLVAGEPGVGKTRLTSDLARAAHADGATVAIGRCDEHVAAPYSPWLEVLRHLIANAPDAVLTGHVDRHGGELTRIAPELGRRISDLPPPRDSDPDTERLALFDAVLDLLAAVADEAPLLVLIDDAHWADGASLHLLARVVGHLRADAPVLLLVTYRDTDVDRVHPLSAMLGDLQRQPRVERISLRGMDETGVAELLVAAGGNELDEQGLAFAQALARETEGNPFFLGETLRHLIDTGVLVQEGGQWRGTVSVEEVGIPQGVRDVVGRRLSRLSDATNDALRTGAVIGREFDLDLVVQLSGQDEAAVLDAVDEALAASLVDEVADRPGRLTFAHALVRSTLLDELSTSRRIRIHRTVAEALEAGGRATDAELAYHFSEAAATGVADQAIRYALQAARTAVRSTALEEAARFCTLALDACDAGDGDPHTRGTILIERAEAWSSAGQLERGHTDALAAAELGRSLGDAALIGRAGAAYQGYFTSFATPGDPVAVQLMREGLVGMDDAPLDQRALVAASLVNALIFDPSDEAVGLAVEAERLARSTGDDHALIHALNARNWTLRTRDHASLEVLSLELVELTQRAADENMQCTAWYGLMAARLARGDLPGAVEAVQRADNMPAMPGYATANLAATLAIVEGRFAEARVLSDEMHDRSTALGLTSDAMWTAHHAKTALYEGRTDDAFEWIERSRAAFLPVLPTLTLVYLDLGDLEQAAATSAEAEQFLSALPPIATHYSHDLRAEAAARLGDAELAASLRPGMAPFAGELIANDPYITGAIEHALGLLDHAEGKYDEAVPLLEHGLFVVAAHGWRALEARHRVDLARTLLARGAGGDTELALAHLEIAEALAAELGMAPTTRLAEQLRSLA